MTHHPPIISIVGKSNSGKTTLIERLIPALKARGYRIATIKHAGHDFDADQPGKDSHRHKKAGADAVMVAASGRFALIKDLNAPRLDDLAFHLQDMDLILTEGYKKADKPKVEVCRAARSAAPMCLEDPHLVALVTDVAGIACRVPIFDLGDAAALADFIENRFLRRGGPGPGFRSLPG
jgi:molybdopterin-guanine dinucleotide biosynthesis protein B